MSSDCYFDDDFDDAAFEEIDAIEAAALKGDPPAKLPPPAPLARDSSIEMSFDLDETDLEALDDFVEKAYHGQAAPVAGPSRPFVRTNSNSFVQTTLFGGVAASQPSTSKPRSSQSQQTKSATGTRNLFGKQAKKTKVWDHTAFAKSGWTKRKSTKGKGKAREDEDKGEDEEDNEMDLPPPFVPIGPYPPPMKLKPDLLEAKHWIFPINRGKRDYQYNIVKHCLFENTLVALPTGLGKTFVAGVVMLNYWRWFPEGKVIFLAPTRPLVAQQIEACHETCGIPGSDGIELTGQVKSSLRARLWEQKRVFYMTSQTLESDLKSGACDPMDVILLVLDEAHHASGNHSYNQVVRFLMARNPHFRLLALSATPGNTPDKVQTIVDGLHISHIEIRSEDSLDISPYTFDKIVQKHIIKPTGEITIARDLLVKYIDKIANPLRARGLFLSSSIKLHPFQPMAMLSEKKNLPHYKPLKQLAALARALMYLLTGSFSACHEYLIETRKKDEEAGPGKKIKPTFKGNPDFPVLMKELDAMKAKGRVSHPKTEKLKDILIQFFGARVADPDGKDNDEASKPNEGCVIVFSSFRAVVEDIVQELASHKPLIRAAAFVGQQKDKAGNKGLKQKEQRAMIQSFQRGEINVLVATSIGEEGLDIGEVDCTICYDSDKTPVRLIQRLGRTGRKRTGNVHMLLAEAREEDNLDKAKSGYGEVQKVISRGELYEFYADVPRLLPDHVKPECVEKVMEMQPFVREVAPPKELKGAGGKRAPKRKRNDDPDRNIPPDMPTAFQPASSVWNAFKIKKAKIAAEPIPEDSDEFDALGQDNESDEEIQSGNIFAMARRTQSEDGSKAKKKIKESSTSRLRRAKTDTAAKKGKSKTKSKKSPTPPPELPHSQFLEQGEDDEDDLDIENGLVFGRPARTSTSPFPSNNSSSVRPSSSRSSRGRELEIVDPSDTEDDLLEEPARDVSAEPRVSSRELSPPAYQQPANNNNDMSWLVDDDDDMAGIELVDSSPPPPRKPSPSKFERFQIGDESLEISQPFTAPPPKRQRIAFESPTRPTASSSKVPDTSKRKSEMPPPALPARFSRPEPDSPTGTEAPEPTFPVQVRKRRRILDILSSPQEELEPPAPSQRRLHHAQSTPVRQKPNKSKAKDKPKTKRAKPSLLDKNLHMIFEAEAAHSGDEVSEGYSEEDDEEDEEDRAFIKNSPLTQASPSYNQTMAYRHGLMTQAPGFGGPAFANGPVRARPFGRISPRHPRAYLPMSSPEPEGEDDEPNEYEFGTFVVDDSADISLEVDSDDAILEL